MVNDFLPRREASRSGGSVSHRTHTARQESGPAASNTAASKNEEAREATPQLTHAPPFLRAGQLSRREALSQQHQAARSEEDGTSLGSNGQPEPTAAGGGNASPPPEQSYIARFKVWWQKLSKKKKIIIVASAAIVLIGAAVGAYFLFFNKHEPVVTKKPNVQKQVVKEAPKSTKVASRLTGLEVEPEVNQRPVTGVMIENSPDARPQAGLADAGVIFEAIAEGGITRFLALFQDTRPDYIGPVRSVRPYYIQWATGFNASIAHVGGSPEALQDMKQWNVRDLDQFAGGSYFWRINTRFAPHNVYTSIAKLNEYETKKGYGAADYTGFARKPKEIKPTAVPTAKGIDLDISGLYYNVRYDYNPDTNCYARKVGGTPHLDDKSGAQLAPKVIIALVMPYSLQADRIHSVYQTIGAGKAYIFQDGAAIEGDWHKEAREKQFTFTDTSGKEIKLNPGQTWVTAVGAASDVTYQP